MSIIRANSTRTKGLGFTLIEVLVSILLMGVGLLGMVALQLQGLSNTNNSYFRTQAILLATDIIERMRANQAGIDDNLYNAIDTSGSTPSNPGGCASGCTSAQLAAQDIYEWNQLFTSSAPTIPGATGTVTAAGSNEFTVIISWVERGFKSADATGAHLEDEAKTHTITAIVQ
jgi:type IV pilus assembly protein PilV